MKTRIFERKRVLSVLLALCMALALLPGTAMAVETEEDAAMPLMVAGDNTPPVVSGMSMDNPGRTVRPGGQAGILGRRGGWIRDRLIELVSYILYE